MAGKTLTESSKATRRCKPSMLKCQEYEDDTFAVRDVRRQATPSSSSVTDISSVDWFYASAAYDPTELAQMLKSARCGPVYTAPVSLPMLPQEFIF